MSAHASAVVIVLLATLLALVSAVAGALWFRIRSAPAVRALQLARELADRQRALEALIDRLESSRPPSPRKLVVPHAPAPAEQAESPAPQPTLIAVPDLAQPLPESSPAASELAQRFGSIWRLADEGAAPESIARVTGQPVGQVELILGLRRHRGPAADPVSTARPLA